MNYMNSRKLCLQMFGLLLLLSACINKNAEPITQETTQQPYATLPSTSAELLELLLGSNAELRIAASRAIVNTEFDPNEVVPVLIQNLYYSTNSDVRRAAVEALGTIGPNAKEAVPFLFITLLSDTVHVRRASAVTLGRIGHPSAVPALAIALSDEYVNTVAAEAIEQIRGQTFVAENERHLLTEDNQLLYVSIAQRWWNEQGQFEDWISTQLTPIP